MENNSRTINIKRFSYHLIWLVTLLEAITVPFLIFLIQHQPNAAQTKAMWQGFIVGSVGTYIIFFIFNKIAKRMSIRLFKTTVVALQPLYVIAIWGGIILAFLFLFQKLVLGMRITNNPFLILSMAGFVATTLSTIITVIGYSLLQNTNLLTLYLYTPNVSHKLVSMSFFYIAVLAGIYEAIALPIINVWTLFTSHQILIGLITGAMGGFIGSSVVVLCYNFFARKNKLYIMFKTRRS